MSGITGYTLQVLPKTPPSWEEIGSGSTSSHTVTSLTNGQEYTFNLSAKDGAAQGPIATVKATPAATSNNKAGTAPRFTSNASFNAAENETAVATVTAVDDDAEETSVSFALQGGADRSKFSITSAGVLSFKTAPDHESPADAASTDPANAAANNQYMMTVRATSGEGARQQSTDQTITVTVTDADDAPTGAPAVTGTEQVGQTLTASTTGIADEDGLPNPGWSYQWVRLDSGTATDISGATSSSYALQSADQGKRVRVKVSFTDDESNAHTLESAGTGVIGAAATQAPDPVTGISATHNGTSLTVSWTAPARATHYDVTYFGGGVHGRAAWNRAGTSLTITCDSRAGTNCVAAGSSYTVGVRARNAAGERAWANSAAATFSLPGPVANIQVTHNGTSLTVSWDGATGAAHYDVVYRRGTGAWARAASDRAGTSITITCDSRHPGQNQNCVAAGGTYTVGVRAGNAGGHSAWVNATN